MPVRWKCQIFSHLASIAVACIQIESIYVSLVWLEMHDHHDEWMHLHRVGTIMWSKDNIRRWFYFDKKEEEEIQMEIVEMVWKMEFLGSK